MPSIFFKDIFFSFFLAEENDAKLLVVLVLRSLGVVGLLGVDHFRNGEDDGEDGDFGFLEV